MSENSVIAALKAALAATPDDPQLIIHLATLLEKIPERKAEAYDYAQRAIVQDPANAEVLSLALNLAKALGHDDVAAAYAAVLQSLSGPSSEPSPIAEAKASTAVALKPERVRGAKLQLVSGNAKDDAFVDVEDSHIYLDDVGGMEHVKKRLQLSFLAPLKNPELMAAYGKTVGGGLLLYGPPGCGKTYIARALAGELGAKFINLGLTDILDMYVGESERKLHQLFESARRHAPAVLFIDELDALGQKRSQLRNSGMRTLVNQLLAEMDSLGQENKNLFILAATNHPWDVDAALRRPGRFDRTVAVYPPDEAARIAILEHQLKTKPTDNIDVAYIAHNSPHFSGADLTHLCNAAVEYVLEESIETGKVRPLRTEDFKNPLSETKASTLPWFDTARNYAMFANENGSYDDLLDYINTHKL